MENQYRIFMGVEEKTKKVFENHLKQEGFQIIPTEEKEILFAKKGKEYETKEAIETEQIAIKIVVSILKKHSGKGFLYIDFSKDMQKVLEILKENHNQYKIDNRIFWRIRQAVTKAIIEKYKTGEAEYGNIYTTN